MLARLLDNGLWDTDSRRVKEREGCRFLGRSAMVIMLCKNVYCRFYIWSRACIESRAAVKLDELHARSRHAAHFRMNRKAIWSHWADVSNMRRASRVNWLTKEKGKWEMGMGK